MTRLTSGALSYDPAQPGFQDDPYPLLIRLREHDPLHVTPGGLQVVTRYHDVRALLRDPACLREFPSRGFALSGRMGATAQSFARAVVSRDPPDHTRFRALLAPPFTAGAVAALRPVIESLVDDLLEQAERRGGEHIDLMLDVANHLPYLVNCVILGLPTQEYGVMAPWIAAIEDASMPSPPPAAVTASDRAVEALRSYLEPYFAGRRQPLPGQLLARLAAAAAGQDSLSRVDLMDNAIGLFPAGAETTTGLIGNAVSLLLDAPGRLEMARGDQAMAPDLIEEALRLESPINAAYRWVAGRVTVDSGAVQAGRVLILSLAAANRDPRAFIDPAQLDIQRRDRHPHVAFGAGRHVCLGAHLARLECEVTLRRLLHRYRTIEAAGPRIRKRSVELRCLARLPVRVVRQ